MKRLFLMLIVALATCSLMHAQRFALVDTEYILKQIPAYTQATQKMDALTKQYQNEIQKKTDVARQMYEEYQKTADGLTKMQRSQKEEAIVNQEKAVSELRNKYFGPEGEMQKKRQELLQPFQDKIYEAVKTLATQKGFDVVFDRSSAQSMIFASPRIDISNEVLKLLGY